MSNQIIRWINLNKLGIFIGAVGGFIASKLLYASTNGGRQALVQLQSATGPIDNWLSMYNPQTIVFIKMSILLITIFALLGGFVDSKVK